MTNPPQALFPKRQLFDAIAALGDGWTGVRPVRCYAQMSECAA